MLLPNLHAGIARGPTAGTSRAASNSSCSAVTTSTSTPPIASLPHARIKAAAHHRHDHHLPTLRPALHGCRNICWHH